jgi:hypothetical protein
MSRFEHNNQRRQGTFIGLLRPDQFPVRVSIRKPLCGVDNDGDNQTDGEGEEDNSLA